VWPGRNSAPPLATAGISAPSPALPPVTAPAGQPEVAPGGPFQVEFPAVPVGGSIVALTVTGLILGGFLTIWSVGMKGAGFFRIPWLAFCGLVATVLIAAAVVTARNAGIAIRVRGDRFMVTVERMRGQRILQTWQLRREEGIAVRSYNTGSSNGQPRIAIELVGKDKVLKLRRWYPADLAAEPLRQLRNMLDPG
jgi:hypothetical protein